MTERSGLKFLVINLDKSWLGKQSHLFFIKFPHLQCGGTFHDSFGQIQSPNYPKRWKEDTISCVWTITAPKGYNVRLTFLDFSLDDFFGECALEKLSVHDGTHITGPALGKLLCGEANPPQVTSNENAITLYLTSKDNANFGSGFKLQWDIVRGM